MRKLVILGGFAFVLLSGTANAGFVTLSVNGAQFTVPTAVSGNEVVGVYGSSLFQPSGFLYKGGHFSTFTVPGATLFSPSGISGNTIVGDYHDASGIHGFLSSSSAPEPSSLSLLVIGALGLAGFRWRSRQVKSAN